MKINYLSLTLYAMVALFITVVVSGLIFIATAPEGTFDDESWEYREKGTKYKDSGSAIGCTEDARMCPDGSSVGRIPPACQFAECPHMEARPPEGNAGGIACTMDARMCPDGSFVGRVPPTCEFAACAPVLAQ